MVESWAEEFRIENYRASRRGDQILIQFERPERIEQVLAPRNADLQTTNLLYGLQNRYGRYNDDPESWQVDSLEDDLATARNIDEAGPGSRRHALAGERSRGGRRGRRASTRHGPRDVGSVQFDLGH